MISDRKSQRMAIVLVFTNDIEIIIMDEVTGDLILHDLSDQHKFYRKPKNNVNI